uniref:Uncharacterized protein n=1 Tax=Anguilla anguilla TaxID=7936 RepID=A0A0E9PSX9_ANGAN
MALLIRTIMKFTLQNVRINAINATKRTLNYLSARKGNKLFCSYNSLLRIHVRPTQ